MRGARACRSKMRRKKLMVGCREEKTMKCVSHSVDESDARDGESSCTRPRRSREVWGGEGGGRRALGVWRCGMRDACGVVIDRVWAWFERTTISLARGAPGTGGWRGLPGRCAPNRRQGGGGMGDRSSLVSLGSAVEAFRTSQLNSNRKPKNRRTPLLHPFYATLYPSYEPT